MRMLVACERSGIVRDAFRARGHDAFSCDLQAAEDSSPFHIVGDALEVIACEPWPLVIAHPPCTHLSSSGLHRTVRGLRPIADTEAAIQFVFAIIDAARGKLAIENPVGFLSRALRKPDQIIQPYQFGDDASKATCLWLRGLPMLRQTAYIAPRMANGLPRWSNQTDSGQNRLSPGESRATDRARTYPGIAAAMAQQWGADYAA